MSNAAHTVQTAIEDSIREGRTITLTARRDTSVSLIAALKDACDDYVRITAGDNRIDGDVVEVREYWGTDDDGDDWRIHLHETA